MTDGLFPQIAYLSSAKREDVYWKRNNPKKIFFII